MTRPGPRISSALAGAVDLSALKQRPASSAESASTGAPGGIEVTETNLEADVLVRSTEVPVVVLLWSPRSDASVQLGEALGALSATDGAKWVFATVNVDTTPRVAQMFGVQAVPTVVALAAGRPLSSFEGMQPPDQLRRWIDSLLNAVAGKLSGAGDEGQPEEVDPQLEQARALLDEGDFDAARNAYQAILDADPNHAEAKGAVRQIGFLQRATTHPQDAVAIADAAPDDIAAALAAADVEILQQQIEPAFARLTALVRRTAGDDRTTVRTRLIELFDLFDPADPAVIAGRRNLANALY
ncbi:MULTISPECIES: tetratricopeptide repeat protein [Mycolicibacterium]|uniref:Thioredoxin domain-containing protein n=2 Tax=Mycolicibacterium gilvum TaxID=1804 RepID=E6TAB3_MYCSR|nr:MULTISPECIES: tetratricopeptide repeat protein [Mycolicibacterium]ABP44820.1 Thioredoxin domain [Mycolicibacterium gilvum PYR-GCK]ADT98437.1 thioredoxin domain-containing protein [Mycolicibacterium gilvum Spyr1]MBV5244820.1 tetratricopeptide repeat protein [Mycolicibacterium sp. PAM1]